MTDLQRRPVVLLWALAGVLLVACAFKAAVGGGHDTAQAAERATARAAKPSHARSLTIAWGGDTTLGSAIAFFTLNLRA